MRRHQQEGHSLILAETFYHHAKAPSQHYPSPTLYGDHLLDVSPKNSEAFASQEHLDEIYDAIINIVVYLKINTHGLPGP